MADKYTGDLSVKEAACTVTCESDDCPNTLGITTGCKLLLHYANGDGEITKEEYMNAVQDYFDKIITKEEADFVEICWKLLSVNNKCPGCYILDIATGDITKVTLDDKLLPEGGTLDWIVNDDANVKIFFKNAGGVAGAFHIWLTDESGDTITGCDITTEEIPADDIEYYVDLCVFLPDAVKVKTLTAHIDP